MSTQHTPFEDIAEIAVSTWHRDISADDATDQITDLMEAYAAARVCEALEEAAAICDEEAEAYQRHIETGKNKANALRCLCAAEGLADAIRAHSAKAEGKS